MLFLCLFASLGVKAQMDSLSYALGYTMTRSMLEWKACVTDATEAREFVRGLEDRMIPPELLGDSCFMYNYTVGSMQGIFMSDGFSHGADSLLPSVDCIVEGLRMVAEDKAVLPGDTVEALRVIRSFPDSIRPESLPDEQKCRFFVAYGLMKALQPGLRAYLDELGLKHVEVCQKYYARGMADALSLMRTPRTAYEAGAMLALTSYMESIGEFRSARLSVKRSDFIAGARAMLALDAPRMSPEEIARVAQRAERAEPGVITEVP